jgi:hypothetical protein
VRGALSGGRVSAPIAVEAHQALRTKEVPTITNRNWAEERIKVLETNWTTMRHNGAERKLGCELITYCYKNAKKEGHSFVDLCARSAKCQCGVPRPFVLSFRIPHFFIIPH